MFWNLYNFPILFYNKIPEIYANVLNHSPPKKIYITAAVHGSFMHFLFIFLKILFILERIYGHMCKHAGEGAEGEKTLADSALSKAMASWSHDPEITTWAETKSQTLKWLRHQGTSTSHMFLSYCLPTPQKMVNDAIQRNPNYHSMKGKVLNKF